MTRNDRLIASLRAEVARSDFFSKLGPERGRVEITGASVEARALILAALQEKSARRLAIIVPGEAATADFETALRLFHRDPQCVSIYPSPSLSPYQDVAPSLGVVREEIRAIGMIADRAADVLIVPARALFQRLPQADEFRQRTIRIAEGDDLDMHALLEKLVENGFVRTDLVGEAGEFAFRGGILDLFPPTTPRPVRIELFGDTVESLRWFDVETQRSEDAAGPVAVMPMTQFPLDKASRSTLARRLSLDFQDRIYKRDLAEKIDRLSENGTFPGIEHYLPVAANSLTFADVIGGEEWSLVLIEPDQISTTIAKFESLLRSEFEAAVEKGRAVYPPEKIVAPGSDVLEFIGSAQLAMSEVHVRDIGGSTELRVHASQTDRFTNRLSEFTADLGRGHREGQRQLFFCATKGGHEKVERILREFEVPFVNDSPAFAQDVVVTSGNLARGFAFEAINQIGRASCRQRE